MNWVLGGFLLLGFWYGWRKGLLLIVSGIIGLILQLYIAFHFNGPMGAMIEEYTGFTDRVSLFLSEHFPSAQFAAAFPVEFLPKSFMPAVEKMIDAPVHGISEMLLYALSFMVLFFLTKLVFNTIGRFLTKGLDHTLIGPVNRFFGGVLGIFFTALIIGLGLMAFSWIFGDRDLPGANLGSFTHLIRQSDLAEFLLSLF